MRYDAAEDLVFSYFPLSFFSHVGEKTCIEVSNNNNKCQFELLFSEIGFRCSYRYPERMAELLFFSP